MKTPEQLSEYQTYYFRDKLLSLLKEYSYKEGDFELSSGKRSNYFIDCKKTLLTAEGHYLVGSIICKIIKENGWNIDTVAGVALGGCSIASSVSLMSNFLLPKPINAIYIRKDKKDHGTASLIEGSYDQNGDILIVEDVITTGQSTISAIKSIRNNGACTISVISIVDRLEGGKEAIQDIFSDDVYITSLFTINDFKK